MSRYQLTSRKELIEFFTEGNARTQGGVNKNFLALEALLRSGAKGEVRFFNGPTVKISETTLEIRHETWGGNTLQIRNDESGGYIIETAFRCAMYCGFLHEVDGAAKAVSWADHVPGEDLPWAEEKSRIDISGGLGDPPCQRSWRWCLAEALLYGGAISWHDTDEISFTLAPGSKWERRAGECSVFDQAYENGDWVAAYIGKYPQSLRLFRKDDNEIIVGPWAQVREGAVFSAGTIAFQPGAF